MTQLAQVYKKLDAAVGQFGLATLGISTKAPESNAPGDSTYNQLENRLSSFNGQRDGLASRMIALLEGAEFNGQSINGQQANQLISQGNTLLNHVNGCC